MTQDDLTAVVTGLHFPECPRWHNQALWFSDIAGKTVYTLDTQNNCRAEVTLEGEPAGLGWDPEGKLLIVSCLDNCLLRQSDQGLQIIAYLSELSLGECNDMVVSSSGHAYIGHHNGKLDPAQFQPATLIKVDSGGAVEAVADDMLFPNGAVLTANERGLIIAESFGRRLSYFDVHDDGSLSGRRVWADLGNAIPDGICIDAEGAVWVCYPLDKEVLRVREGGEIVECIELQNISPFACALGGSDGRTLYICAADGFGKPALSGTDTGTIFTAQVTVPVL